MKTNVLEEEIIYRDNKRITVQKVETVTSLADDMTILANYHGTLASLQNQLEQLESATVSKEQQAYFDGEVARLKSEKDIIRKAIAIQEKYIRGFTDGTI